MYYVLLTYLCKSCALVQWICCHNIYCVVNTPRNTFRNLNNTVCGQGQYVYAIATVSTVFCCCCRVFRKLYLRELNQ